MESRSRRTGWTAMEVMASLLSYGFVADARACWRRASDGMEVQLEAGTAILRPPDGRTAECISWDTLVERLVTDNL